MKEGKGYISILRILEFMARELSTRKTTNGWEEEEEKEEEKIKETKKPNEQEKYLHT